MGDIQVQKGSCFEMDRAGKLYKWMQSKHFGQRVPDNSGRAIIAEQAEYTPQPHDSPRFKWMITGG